MGRQNGKPLAAEELRRRAEVQFAARQPTTPTNGDETQALLHELAVHQIELEMQNEQLRQGQLELEISRDRYAALYHNAPVGYLTIDSEGTITECNLTACELLGRPRDKVLGLKLYGLLSPTDAGAFHMLQLALLRTGGNQSCEFDLKRANGESFRARLELVADVDIAAGLRTHMALIDMTELREAQVDLQVSETRFGQIAAHIEDVFYLRELDGVISYVSPGFDRIWGRSPSEIVGKPTGWMDTIDEADRDRVSEAWARLRTGATINEVYRIRRPDGTLRWVQSRGFPIVADDGAVRGSVGVVRDITHERMLEEALRQAQKMEAVGTLASGVAHNLRNILQAIVNFVEVARLTAAAGQPVFEILDRAASATRRGATLIDQLMTFARKQEPAASLAPVRIDDILREAVGLIKPLVSDTISLQIEAGAPGAVVVADPVQMEQILLNLASNARDAMPRGGTLTITSRETVLDERSAREHGLSPGPHVVVTVKDSGKGMDAATKARVFEPFFTTKDIGKGTGLGLSTVFGLVRHFGGGIEVDSSPEVGTTFTVYLPASAIDVLPSAEEPLPDRSDGRPSSRSA